MTISLKHSFQSAIVDDAEPGLLSPNDWNAEHVLTQATGKLLGRTTAGTGATEEITLSASFSFTGGVLDIASLPAASFANPSASIGLTGVNGSAATALRSDAAPPLSSAIQSALTSTNHALAKGTGAFGFGSIGPSAKNSILASQGSGNIAADPAFKVHPTPFYSSTVSSAAVGTWTKYTGPDSNTYVDCAWSPELGRFVATATGGQVKSSADGITWTLRTAAAVATWHGVAWAPSLSLFAAVGGGNGTSNIMTSPDGITWTARTAPNTNNWDGLVWSPELSLFVAVSYSGNTSSVMTSPDGITWTARTAPNSNQWTGIAWSPELTLFVAVGITGTGNRVMTSPDGITWTARTSASDDNWDGIAWSPQLGLFAAVSYSANTTSVMTSPDGITWTTRTSPTNTWTRIAWSPELGQFAATAGTTPATSNVMTSSDGITWTTHTTTNANWGGIAWSPELGIFAAVSWAGDSMTSTPPQLKGRYSALYGGLLGIGTFGSLTNRQLTIGTGFNGGAFGGIGFAAAGSELWALGFEPASTNQFVLYNAGLGTYALTVAATNNAIVSTGSISGLSFIPTGSSAPTNGLYLPAANTIGWATNSTFRGLLNPSGQFVMGPNVAPVSGVKLTINNNTAAVPSGGLTGITATIAAANGSANRLILVSAGTGASNAINYLTSRGTLASPTATQSGDVLNANFGIGYGATGYGINAGVGFVTFSTENYTDTAQGARLAVYATNTGTAAIAEVSSFYGSGSFAVGLTTVDPGASGIISAVTGYRINNAAASGNVLRGNGTNFISAQLAFSDLSGSMSADQGGTGLTTYAVGDLIYASATTPTLAKLAAVATGNALISGGVNTAPSWGKIALSTHVSGTLPVANGGTGGTKTNTCRIYLNGAQTINTGSDTLILFDTVDFDTDSIADVATNHRITPNVAGTFSVYAQIYGANASLNEVVMRIRKNGSSIQVADTSANVTNAEAVANAAVIVAMNGTTDYIDVVGRPFGANAGLQTGSTSTNLHLFRIGP